MFSTTPSSHPVPASAHRDARRSLWALAFVPVTLIGGVVLLMTLIGDPNVAGAPQRWDNAWRVTVGWAVIVVPTIIGMDFGYRAMREGDRLGRLGLALNGLVFALFTGLTLVGGVLDGF